MRELSAANLEITPGSSFALAILMATLFFAVIVEDEKKKQYELLSIFPYIHWLRNVQ